MKKIFLSIALLTGLSGCSDLLIEKPDDRLSNTAFYKTEADALSAIYAIYNPLRIYGDRYGTQFTSIADYGSGRGFLIAFAQYAGPMLSTTDGQYQSFYLAIRNANIALERIPGIEFDENKKKELLGEAYFLRALSYRNLVRSWGGVPIRKNSLQGIGDIGGKRASVQEVYDFVIEDLKQAETLLPSTPPLAGRPGKWAAKTLLAEVYLYTEQWEPARDKAEEVIASKAYSLVRISKPEDFELIFGPTAVTSSEDVFSIKFSRTEGSYVPLFYALPNSAYSAAGYGSVYAYPTAPVLVNWDTNDLRRQFGLYTRYPNKSGIWVENDKEQPIRFGKFKDPGFAPSHGNDYPVLRYPDALLIYAEAANQSNDGPTALAFERLNQVRRRGYGLDPDVPSTVDLGPQDASDPGTFRTLVLRERAYEFVTEGKRWFDLVRTNTVKQVILEAKGITIPDYFLLFPIPATEIDNNPDLTQADQNPGY